MNPEDYKKQAVDLSKVAAERKAEEERLAQAAMREAEKVAASWDKAMRRAFKGIVARPIGRAALMRAAERGE